MLLIQHNTVAILLNLLRERQNTQEGPVREYSINHVTPPTPGAGGFLYSRFPSINSLKP